MAQNNKRDTVKSSLERIEELLKNGPERKSFWSPINLIFQIICTIITIFSVISFLPRISVSPGQSLDSHNVFKTPFIIKNDGYTVLENVHYSYYVKNLQIGSSTLMDSPISSFGDISKLNGNEQSTIFFNERALTIRPGSLITYGEVYIKIQYQPWIFWYRKEQKFQFKIMKDKEGELFWYPFIA